MKTNCYIGSFDVDLRAKEKDEVESFKKAVNYHMEWIINPTEWPSISMIYNGYCKKIKTVSNKDILTLNIEFTMDIDDNNLKELDTLQKAFKHHLDWLIDMNEWSEVLIQAYNGKLEKNK